MNDGSPPERFGPYLVYERLGVGGMAEVHRAVAKGADPRRPIALKRMLAHIASNDEMVKSFVREARLASYLRHQNVPQTHDLGKVGDVYFIAMELITGRNLREVLKHCAKTTGPMPVPIALNIINQICDALDYAHNLCDNTGTPLGIIHRDVSPSNVIVSETGVVKLIDFGIAKVSNADTQTRSGTLKGKFAYMAPEYFAGQLDARADLFAMGVIAHELLTNRPLFSGRDDVDTATRVRTMPVAPPSQKNPHVPPEIDDVVMTALARDPERRWQHATALRTALTTLTQQLNLVATNTQVVQWLDWTFTHGAGAPPPSHLLESATATETEPQTKTEVDAPPVSEDPSIAIELGTAELLGLNQTLTLTAPNGAPSPPNKTPAGTQANLPAQQPIPTPVKKHVSGPVATVLGSALGPGAAASPIAVPAAGSSPPARMRAPSVPPPVEPSVPLPSALMPLPASLAPSSERPNSTVLGTAAPPVRAVTGPASLAARAGRISTPPPIHASGAPMSAALAAHLSAAQAMAGLDVHATSAPTTPPAGTAVPAHLAPGLAAPVSAAPGFPAAQGSIPPRFSSAPGFAASAPPGFPAAQGSAPPGFSASPGLPAGNMMPFASSRPPTPIPAPTPAYDPAQFAAMPRDPAQPVFEPSTAAAPRRRSRWWIVALVVLVAAIAATAAYFVLPLLS